MNIEEDQKAATKEIPHAASRGEVLPIRNQRLMRQPRDTINDITPIAPVSRNISNRTKALCELSSDDTPGVNIGKMGLVTQEMLEDIIIAYKDKDSDLYLRKFSLTRS